MSECPRCNKDLILMVGNIPIGVTLDVYNENAPINKMFTNEKGKPITNCMMCGKPEVEKYKESE